jgi:hypothetical protein
MLNKTLANNIFFNLMAGLLFERLEMRDRHELLVKHSDVKPSKSDLINELIDQYTYSEFWLSDMENYCNEDVVEGIKRAMYNSIKTGDSASALLFLRSYAAEIDNRLMNKADAEIKNKRMEYGS